MVDYTTAKSDVVLSARPRQRIGELKLAAKDVRCTRLTDRERNRSASCISRGQILSFPQRHRIAIQVSKSSFVDHMRIEDHRVIHLSRPRTPSVSARDAGSTGAP